MRNQFFCIQHILMPNFAFGASEEKYQRGALALYADGKTVIAQGGKLSFDTYYNALSTVVWCEQCDIQNLAFQAKGHGHTTARLLLVTDVGTIFELARNTLVLNDSEQIVFEVSHDDISHRGLIYVEFIAAEGPVTFSGGGWYTIDIPRRDVKLGISITHFNRKQYVLPSIARVKKEILDDPEYKDKILFTVVDNSQNITSAEAPGVDVISNANTGGSGGFMRGLLHYQNDTDATHVLFMDDDASCETESIKRAYWILSYAVNDNSAVVGSLFLDDRPDVLIEKGAKFDYMCRPAFHGWNMKEVGQVVRAETANKSINYGAWWFFAFPIAEVKHYAFPFFVRGDDILFSMINKFNLITEIGIACYGESFATKVSAMNWYLDTRNHLVNTFYFQKNSKFTLKAYRHFYLNSLFSHQYGSVDAIRLALKHALEPIEFWESNYDLALVRPEINQLAMKEKQHAINFEGLKLSYASKKRHSTIDRFKRKLTLNGLLLPMKQKTVFQPLSYNAYYPDIFRYKSILYFNPVSSKGYVAEISRTAFFKRLGYLIFDSYQIWRQFSKQKQKYQNNIDVITSKLFWERILLQKDNTKI